MEEFEGACHSCGSVANWIQVRLMMGMGTLKDTKVIRNMKSVPNAEFNHNKD
jgi:hypothetical protein